MINYFQIILPEWAGKGSKGNLIYSGNCFYFNMNTNRIRGKNEDSAGAGISPQNNLVIYLPPLKNPVSEKSGFK
jgi:hypothetical protein